ncbi:spore germination protein GerPC [Guptibacillus algicola]|uniref:spore germination protein GerPC n=1 Tax=Guptibacillus algicola TaxID=225844 RepID=UPI001CD1D57A|nr:spore germination protein GerPC [Alkalihalobacillus algicola]MCA0987709.1 spore germination protein GerPC [Alkalihalobacillus algicola]
MYPNDNLYAILQRMQETIAQQDNRITKLEKKIKRLELKMQEQSQTPKTNIEKVEYKFDQLKIERLDGTLNIGLTPGAGGEMLEDFTVNGQPQSPNSPAASPESIQAIQQNVQSYMQRDALPQLMELEKQYNYPLDDPYRQFILNDIHKQLDQRINHYLSENGTRSPSASNEEVTEEIVEKIKRDVVKGMEAFIKNLPKGMEPQ